MSILTENPEEIKKRKMQEKAEKYWLYAMSSTYDNVRSWSAQAHFSAAAAELRKTLWIEQKSETIEFKAIQSLAYGLSYGRNFVDDPDIQKDISELAQKLRDKYLVQ